MKILVCEDSLEGIFTAIYEAYELKCIPEETYIQVSEEANYQLFAEYISIDTNVEKAQKVANTLHGRFGIKDYEDICYVVSSHDTEKGQAVYQTIANGLKGRKGGSLFDDLTKPYVLKAMELRRNVWHEAHHYMGFVRFEEMAKGVLFAKVSPKNHILNYLAAHFSDRLPGENFVIGDMGRKIFAVHPRMGEWYLVWGDSIGETNWSTEELEYQELFRCFCNSIAIKERKNIKLQKNLLPLRFREYMTEFE